jgi:hypothetical protein
LSNPRGKLHVTPSAASNAEAARPSLVNYVGALAEYQVFLRLEAGSLDDAVHALADAVKAGDLQQARALYAPAHQAYKRIEPMAELFADLDTRINARADYFEKREPTRLHRLPPHRVRSVLAEVRRRPGACRTEAAERHRIAERTTAGPEHCPRATGEHGRAQHAQPGRHPQQR